jgi:hypothetical protein
VSSSGSGFVRCGWKTSGRVGRTALRPLRVSVDGAVVLYPSQIAPEAAGRQRRLCRQLGSPVHTVSASSRFEQEPGAALGFINPVFDKTRRRNVALFVDYLVSLSKASYQRHVVLAQPRQHVERVDIVRIVVGKPRRWCAGMRT